MGLPFAWLSPMHVTWWSEKAPDLKLEDEFKLTEHLQNVSVKERRFVSLNFSFLIFKTGY